MTKESFLWKIYEGYLPTLTEIVPWVDAIAEDQQTLWYVADEIRKKHHGDAVQIRAIIEFSSYCRGLCSYCGLQAMNTKLERFRMPPELIVEQAVEAYDAGYRTVVLQSGEDLYYTADILSKIVADIRTQRDMAITMSVGERPKADYQKMWDAGAHRFLMKHECAEDMIYEEFHPHSSLAERVRCLKDLKEIGFQTGSGFIVGLPGQTSEVLAKDILLIKEMGVHMAGIGPFIPHPTTSLSEMPAGSADRTINTVALARILLPDIHLPATTALGVLRKEAIPQVFRAGANVIMQKVEPVAYRRLYDIYPKEIEDEPSVKERRVALENMITGLGRTISGTQGHHRDYQAW